MEKELLGAALLSREAAETAVSLLSEEDFASELNREVFAAIKKLYDSGKDIDQATVAKRLQDPLYALDLASQCPNSAAAKTYAESVKSDSLKRQLRFVGAFLSDGNYSTEEGIDFIHKSIDSMGQSVSGALAVRELIDKALPLYEKPREVFHLKDWGVRMRSGEVVVVGARPAVGKSAFALQSAEELAEAGQRVRIYSFEMSDLDWAERYIARQTSLTVEKLEDGIGQSGIAFIKQATDKPSAGLVEVIDCASMSISQVIVDMRRFARSGGKVAFIDYLQLAVKQDYENVTEASRQFKLAARSTGLALVILSQLKRNDDKHPTLSDLRQSGAIEQDADTVLLLHRYGEDDAEDKKKLADRGYLIGEYREDRYLSHINIAKNRRGQGARFIPAWFDGREMSWTTVDQVIGGRV